MYVEFAIPAANRLRLIAHFTRRKACIQGHFFVVGTDAYEHHWLRKDRNFPVSCLVASSTNTGRRDHIASASVGRMKQVGNGGKKNYSRNTRLCSRANKFPCRTAVHRRLFPPPLFFFPSNYISLAMLLLLQLFIYLPITVNPPYNPMLARGYEPRL